MESFIKSFFYRLWTHMRNPKHVQTIMKWEHNDGFPLYICFWPVFDRTAKSHCRASSRQMSVLAVQINWYKNDKKLIGTRMNHYCLVGRMKKRHRWEHIQAYMIYTVCRKCSTHIVYDSCVSNLISLTNLQHESKLNSKHTGRHS